MKFTYDKARDGEITVWEGPTAMQWLGAKGNEDGGFFEGGTISCLASRAGDSGQGKVVPYQLKNAKPDTFETAQFP